MPHVHAGIARGHLRKAITALSQSDTFIDILAQELSSAGLFDGGYLARADARTEEDQQGSAQHPWEHTEPTL